MIEWALARSGVKMTDDEVTDFYGFVYKITYSDGMYYYGKKSVWSIRRLPPLKGKKRKRKVIKQSNWKKYAGSSEASKGKKILKKEFLHFAHSKLHLSYLENMVLYSENALFDRNCLNANISGKYYSTVSERKGEWLNADKFS